jgi:predicted nuclease of restriction endonuclease-like (RecB) superfamily
VNERQLMLYYGIGKYISQNSRQGFWGKGAIEAISDQLSKELPGLRGFTSRNLRYMRTFYEEWQMLDTANRQDQIGENVSEVLELTSSKISEPAIMPIWNSQVPNCKEFPTEAFLHIGFTHHRIILRKVKDIDERLFYIRRCANEHLTVDALEDSISADDYRH